MLLKFFFLFVTIKAPCVPATRLQLDNRHECKDAVSINLGDFRATRRVCNNANMRTIIQTSLIYLRQNPFKSLCITTWSYFVILFPIDSMIFIVVDCAAKLAVVIHFVVFVLSPHMSRTPVMETFRCAERLGLAPQQWFYHPVCCLLLAHSKEENLLQHLFNWWVGEGTWIF